MIGTLSLFLLQLTLINAQLQPVINAGQYGADKTWKMIIQDEFEGSGPLAKDSLWYIEDMMDSSNGPLYTVGNCGIDSTGKRVANNQCVKGKRWSAWYNLQDQSKVVYRENGKLALGALVTNEADPTRPTTYTDKGELIDYSKHRFYLPWLVSWAREYNSGCDCQRAVDGYNTTFKFGFFEMDVDFTPMQSQGVRFSAWLMPVYDDNGKSVASNAYNGNPSDGVEIDIIEYETGYKHFGQVLQTKVVSPGGSFSSTKPGYVNTMTEHGIDLRQGTHKIGLLWEKERLVWYVDGIKVMEDTVNVPQVYSHIILSREGNSGVKAPGDGVDADDVRERLDGTNYIPRDPGLYATNMYLDKDKINTDRVLLDYVRVWQEGTPAPVTCQSLCATLCGGEPASQCTCNGGKVQQWTCASGFVGVSLAARGSFDAAKSACAALNMRVAVPGDADENAKVLRTCASSWLGLRETSGSSAASSFSFDVLDSNGQTLNNKNGAWNMYTDWASGEPNRWKFASGISEQCVALENGKWNDRPCVAEATKTPHPECVVCQAKAASTTAEQPTSTPKPTDKPASPAATPATSKATTTASASTNTPSGTTAAGEPVCKPGSRLCVCDAQEQCESSSLKCEKAATGDSLCLDAVKPCLYGAVGCPCTIETSTCGSDFLECRDNVCVAAAATCTPATNGCECQNGACLTPSPEGFALKCQAGVCQRTSAVCEPGTGGCACVNGSACQGTLVCLPYGEETVCGWDPKVTREPTVFSAGVVSTLSWLCAMVMVANFGFELE